MNEKRTDDSIFYDLDYRLEVIAHNPDLIQTVINVLKTFNETVYDFAINKIFYTDDKSEMLPLKQLRQMGIEYVIKISEEHKTDAFTVAHEIAHAFLKHKLFWESTLEQEDEADALATKWGFKKADLNE